MTAELQVVDHDAETLPVLIDRARARLAEVRTCAEAMEVESLADRAMQIARIIGATNETQGDCLRIQTRAQILIAREVEAAQERGEVASHGGDRRSNKIAAADLESIGLKGWQLHEWRKLAQAGEDVVDKAIDDVVAEANSAHGQVSKSAVKRKVSATLPKTEKPAKGRQASKRGTSGKRSPPKPPEPKGDEMLGYLELWLRNGAKMAASLHGADGAVASAHKHRVFIDAEHTRIVRDFMNRLHELVDVDRAA